MRFDEEAVSELARSCPCTLLSTPKTIHRFSEDFKDGVDIELAPKTLGNSARHVLPPSTPDIGVSCFSLSPQVASLFHRVMQVDRRKSTCFTAKEGTPVPEELVLIRTHQVHWTQFFDIQPEEGVDIIGQHYVLQPKHQMPLQEFKSAIFGRFMSDLCESNVQR